MKRNTQTLKDQNIQKMQILKKMKILKKSDISKNLIKFSKQNPKKYADETHALASCPNTVV